MMVAALLQELRTSDIRVWGDGDRLRCSAPAGALTPELRNQLQQCKPDILAFLRSAEELARRQRAIVPLQPHGIQTPIFGVPGHNGDVFCYGTLAQHLGDDQPFYGLQPPGLDGYDKPLSCIADLAAYFAAQIRAFRPSGPCIIAGYCAGGMTAFELGRQLQQQGVTVDSVALFGAWYPATYRWLPQLRMRLREEARSVVTHTRVVTSLSPVQSWRYVGAKLRARRARRAAATPTELDAVLALRAGVERATIAAARRYTPGYFAGRVNLFLPSKEWVSRDNQGLRWRSVAQALEGYYGSAGCDGDNMLRNPHAATFAELFRTCCATNAAGEAGASQLDRTVSVGIFPGVVPD
jgi:thioesterase domain-containing protein